MFRTVQGTDTEDWDSLADMLDVLEFSPAELEQIELLTKGASVEFPCEDGSIIRVENIG